VAGIELVVALARDDDDFALAILIDREVAIDVDLAQVRRPDVAAEVTAVDLGELALAARDAAAHFFV
jgi:hypothetical protein